jgi:hypothetical protein
MNIYSTYIYIIFVRGRRKWKYGDYTFCTGEIDRKGSAPPRSYHNLLRVPFRCRNMYLIRRASKCLLESTGSREPSKDVCIITCAFWTVSWSISHSGGECVQNFRRRQQVISLLQHRKTTRTYHTAVTFIVVIVVVVVYIYIYVYPPLPIEPYSRPNEGRLVHAQLYTGPCADKKNLAANTSGRHSH